MAERSPAFAQPRFCLKSGCWPCWRKLVKILDLGDPRKIQGEVCYFIAAPQIQAVKIGVASEMHKRIRALQTGFPERLRVIHIARPDDFHRAIEIEARYHRHFGRLRLSSGEWFQPSGELRLMLAREAVVRRG